MLKYQKIVKVGNSLAVTLDKDFVRATGIKAGQQIVANYKNEKSVVSLSPVKEPLVVKDEGSVTYGEQEAIVSSKITPELENWTKKIHRGKQRIYEKTKRSLVVPLYQGGKPSDSMAKGLKPSGETLPCQTIQHSISKKPSIYMNK